MKSWPLLIGIILILAVFGSPVLAIRKSDLIASYRTQPVFPAAPDYNPTPKTESFSCQTCLCKRPSDGVIVPCICGAVDPSIYYQVINNCENRKPSGIVPSVPMLPGKIDDLYKLLEKWKAAQKPISSFATDIPSKGKPNIYLYSVQDLTARVRLAPEGAITVSEPVYQLGEGWKAEVRNGSLNGKGDFLFYEALGSDYPWQKEEGYILHAAYLRQDMASMLGQYGFNDKETMEFIDYWVSHLVGDTDYVFFPQETEAVNQDMPLSISPEPDVVTRIWFYAEPLVSAPEPVTHPEKIVRDGFSVVEWGVIIGDDYRI